MKFIIEKETQEQNICMASPYVLQLCGTIKCKHFILPLFTLSSVALQIHFVNLTGRPQIGCWTWQRSVKIRWASDQAEKESEMQH